MAEFKLGRIRFVWKGAWATGTVYFKDDIVRHGGRTLSCKWPYCRQSFIPQTMNHKMESFPDGVPMAR